MINRKVGSIPDVRGIYNLLHRSTDRSGLFLVLSLSDKQLGITPLDMNANSIVSIRKRLAGRCGLRVVVHSTFKIQDSAP